MSTLYIHNGPEYREATAEEISSHPTLTALLETERTPHTFHIRHLLVGSHKDLRIKGLWLERVGFAIGARVSVRVLRKRLIIDVVQEPPQITPPRYRRWVAPTTKA